MFAVELDLQLRDFHLLLDHQIFDPWDIGDCRPHLFRLVAEHRQIVAVELDADLRLHAGEHVTDEMRERLLDGDHHAGHLRKFFAHLFESRFTRLSRLRVEADDDFGNVDPFGVFVEFGAPRAAPEGMHFAVLLHLLQAVVDHAGDMVRRGERRAGRQQHVDLHAPFVEGRQKVAAELRDGDDAQCHGRGDDAENRPRMPHAEANREPGDVLQDVNQQAVLLVGHDFGVGQ